ncbi:MAG: hypothetical protein FWH18_03060 [Marinilabiliaceae bacterium]|nr:hypothetical protein [Marinilabiliaceae bacterium]
MLACIIHKKRFLATLGMTISFLLMWQVSAAALPQRKLNYHKVLIRHSE